VVITVSTFGAIGTSVRALLSELGRRSAQRVPSSFHPLRSEVSWAVEVFRGIEIMVSQD